MHISREKDRNYYSNILSTSAIDNMLRKNNILFGKNVDVTSYADGKRETLNSVSILFVLYPLALASDGLKRA